MKKKELLERIEYLEETVLDLRSDNTELFERIESLVNIIVFSDLNPAVKSSRKKNS